MEKSSGFTEGSQTLITLFRLVGILALIIGIITAALDITFRGWTPIYWFLLSFSAFFGVICNMLFQINAKLGKK
jgi:uncharacterized membrane protein